MTTTYKIGEAAALLNLKTYVLRFWETEFPEIVPLRTEKGQRMYTSEHLALLERIRYLLHERGLTIGGARKALAEEKARGVTYEFGTPSAIKRDILSDGILPEPDEDSDDPPEEEPVAGEEEQESMPAFVFHAEERTGGRRNAQCNLPGLGPEAAMRLQSLSLLNENRTERGFDESGATNREGPERTETQGMLPLFAVVRTAFLAGRAAGKAVPVEGGNNFIPAGFTSVKGPGAGPQADAAQTVPLPDTASSSGPEEPSGRTDLVEARNKLRQIASELEEVAELLRQENGFSLADASSAAPPSRHGQPDHPESGLTEQDVPPSGESTNHS